jgi:hypothetical protein
MAYEKTNIAAYSTESGHVIHRKAATQSTVFGPPIGAKRRRSFTDYFEVSNLVNLDFFFLMESPFKIIL